MSQQTVSVINGLFQNTMCSEIICLGHILKWHEWFGMAQSPEPGMPMSMRNPRFQLSRSPTVVKAVILNAILTSSQ